MLQKCQEWTKEDGDLCQALGQILQKDEAEDVLNAAGAVASLVETPLGLQWLLQDHIVYSRVLEKFICLLNHERERVVNSTAFILARLSLYEPVCQTLLCHPSALVMFGCLVQCLTHSPADTAMNASFTIGCLCSSDQRRCLILAKGNEQKLVSGLVGLLSNGAESEAGQTACFALSCLASKDDGHDLLRKSLSLPGLLDGLLGLLKSGDPDSTWFAAMTVRVFVSRPNGVTRVRKHTALEEQLKRLSVSPSTSSELQEELSACLRKLKRLPKPSPVTLQHQSMACIASWERLEPESGLGVTYSLFDGDTMLYCGPKCQITLPRSHFQHKHSLSLRIHISTSDGDTSPFSESVEISVKWVELRPGPPVDLRVISCTATEVRLKWAGPEGDVKPRSFQVYCDRVLLETTTELGTTVRSLSPSTTYTISVRTLGPGNTRSCWCSVIIHTADGQDHAPGSLAVAVLGCHKLHILWAAPAVPLGRLFSYEVRLNGCVVYLGRECEHTACHLTANTLYTCTVTAITSRGRYESQAVTKRMAKKEYVNMNRLPSVMMQAHIPGKSKSSRVTSEKRSVGFVAELDADAQLSNTKDRSYLAVVPSERHILLHRGVKEHTLWSSPHPIHPRTKTNPDCQAEKGAPDKRRLPLINQPITENVRLLQPVSYNWSDLNHTDHQHNMHEKRLVTGSRANTRLKRRLCLSISQHGTKLS